MTDRELLELAAKAASVSLEWCAEWCGGKGCYMTPVLPEPTDPIFSKRVPWNPLTDDGDALRLAVKLGMGVLYETHHAMGGRFIEVSYDIDEDEGTCKVATELLGTDPYAATRRAIVRAAAEIARQEKKRD